MWHLRKRQYEMISAITACDDAIPAIGSSYYHRQQKLNCTQVVRVSMSSGYSIDRSVNVTRGRSWHQAVQSLGGSCRPAATLGERQLSGKQFSKTFLQSAHNCYSLTLGNENFNTHQYQHYSAKYFCFAFKPITAVSTDENANPAEGEGCYSYDDASNIGVCIQ